jgi:hypothetical protein
MASTLSDGYDDSIIASYVSDERKYVIAFTHVPTGKTAEFPAFITSFNDSFSSEWNTESIFGKTDPIHTFRQTKRNISFAFDIPSASVEEAKTYLARSRNLAKFLYPTYKLYRNSNARVIDKSPFIRVKFSNMIGKGADGNGTALLGKINQIQVNHGIDSGYFDPDDELYPKLIQISISFDVVHEESPTAFPEEIEPPPEKDPPVTDPPPPVEEVESVKPDADTVIEPASGKTDSEKAKDPVANQNRRSNRAEKSSEDVRDSGKFISTEFGQFLVKLKDKFYDDEARKDKDQEAQESEFLSGRN